MFTLLTTLFMLNRSSPIDIKINALLDAIKEVESGGQSQEWDLYSDNGKSYGYYCISRNFWIDACQYDKSLANYPYETVREDWYARQVIIAYWERYGSNGLNSPFEELARMFNGGCRIMSRKESRAWNNTTAYWNKVKDKLNVE